MCKHRLEERKIMTLGDGNNCCVKCSKNGSIKEYFGCQQSFCQEHWQKHRTSLTEQLDEFNRKQEVFQEELDRDTFDYPLLSSVYAWERKSMRKIQEIAEKAREDLATWTERTKKEVKHSLDHMTEEIHSTKTLNNYTELDLRKWTRQLEELRNLFEKPNTISLIEDDDSDSYIRPIKILVKQPLTPLSSSSVVVAKPLFHKTTSFVPEHFEKMHGPCALSDENRVVTHGSYRAGLSQISGCNHYSHGKHLIDLLIEKKGERNLFIRIVSSSHQIISPTLDYSVHGWWNSEHKIINGESKGGDVDDSMQSGDRITLTIDCDHRQVVLEYHRTEKHVHLPIQLQVCPFPWKMLVRLLNTGDSIRILS